MGFSAEACAPISIIAISLSSRKHKGMNRVVFQGITGTVSGHVDEGLFSVHRYRRIDIWA